MLRSGRERIDEEGNDVMSEVQLLDEFVKNPPPEAKKDLKQKSIEKFDPLIQNLNAKFTSEQTQREISGDSFEELYNDLRSLKHVLQKKEKGKTLRYVSQSIQKELIEDEEQTKSLTTSTSTTSTSTCRKEFE